MSRWMLVCALGALVACGDKDDDDDDDTGSGGGWALGSVDEACDAYLDCVADVTPESLAAQTSAYGEGSACWDDYSSAETCAEACEQGTEALGEAYPESEACGGNGPGTPTDVSVQWNGSSLTLDVQGGPGAYWFGIIESTPACGNACWTGEDCYLGYDLGDGSVLSYCHDAGDGGSTTLRYGGDPYSLDDSEETVFTSDYEDMVTYYLYSDPDWDGNDMCWVWGLDSNYYDALGCEWMSDWD